MYLRFSLLLACLFLLPLSVRAHKINVFAWASGDTVTVESGFSRKRPLVNGRVTVQESQSGTVLLEGTGDRQGIFTFTIPSGAREAGSDLLIVVSGGEGHQGEWLLSAAEYGAVKGLQPVTPDSEPEPGDIVAEPPPVPSVDMSELEEMLQEMLTRELAPIRRSLAENRQDRAGFRDIMGGIGYLLGLAGLVAWFRNRPRREKGE